LNEDAYLLKNTNIIFDFGLPKFNFSLPLHHFILLIVNHEKDTRSEVIVLLCIQPEFLVDWEVRFLDVVEGHLCL